MEGIFYRFRSFTDWNKDRFSSEISDIVNNQLTFVNPKLFNDPFELEIHTTDNDLSKYIKDFTYYVMLHTFSYIYSIYQVRESANKLNEKDADKVYFQTVPEMDSVNLQWLRDKIVEKFSTIRRLTEEESYFLHLFDVFYFDKNSVDLCCFTKQIKSMYYWSHYANSHQGYAIEYSFPESLKNDKTGMFYPLKVFYINSINDFKQKQDWYSPVNVLNIKMDYDSVMSPFLMKSKDWETEKEFRLFIQAKDDFVKVDSHYHKINAIYLGLKFDRDSTMAQELIRISKEKGIKLKQMIKDESNNFIMNYQDIAK